MSNIAAVAAQPVTQYEDSIPVPNEISLKQLLWRSL